MIFYRPRNGCLVLCRDARRGRDKRGSVGWTRGPIRSVGVGWHSVVARRRHEQRAKTTRVVVVLSLFLALLAAALLIGGRSSIDPMLHAAAEARQTHRVGEIVFTMPDGTFCRRLAFDNKTADITESTVHRCPEARPRPIRPRPRRLCLGCALNPRTQFVRFGRGTSPTTAL